MPDIIERVIKSTYIFDNIVLVFCPEVIKASSKSDMAMVWINIWNSQNSMKAKSLINRYFNIGYHITMIREININSNIP